MPTSLLDSIFNDFYIISYCCYNFQIEIPILQVGKPGILTCEHSGGEFYWKSHDLSICISPNSFADVIPAKLNITAYLSISNESFCGYHIVSAVFKIDSNVENFDPPVKLRIPHCVTLESNSDCEKMHF